MLIHVIPTEKITPYARNPRQNSGIPVAKVKASLKEFGWQQPIVVDKDMVIVVGHTRYAAALELGMTEVPVHIADTLTPAQIKAYRIADNRTGAEAQWDMELLGLEIEDLKELDFNLDLTGFDADELAGIELEGEPETEGDTEPQIDRAEELRVKWGVELGQMWKLGDHRLICGDCTDAAVVERVMGGEKAALIVTSPPYNQNLDTFKPSGMQKENPSFVNRMASSYSDSMPEEDYQTWQKECLRLWLAYVTDNGSCFYNHKIRYRDKIIISPMMWIVGTGWDIRQEIIWDRGSSITLNARMFIPADERIYWLKAGDDFVFNDTPDIKAWTSVWRVAAKNDVQISAAFATEIPTRCIMAASLADDIVIEPFSGSGTTIIACENLKRKCRAIELSPGYVAVALQRWADHTGKTPTLIS